MIIYIYVEGENFIFKNEFPKNSKVVFLDKIQDSFQNQFSLLSDFDEKKRLNWIKIRL